MLCFGLQNINRIFVPTSKPLNMLGGSLFVVCLLLNSLFLLFCGIFELVIASTAPILLQFGLGKHKSLFDAWFLSTQ